LQVITNRLFVASKSALRLLEQRVLVVVTADGVSSLLRARLLALGLQGRSEGINVAFDGIADRLRGRLLRIGLQSSADLVT